MGGVSIASRIKTEHVNDTLHVAIDALRVGLDVTASDVAYQELFESWLTREQWLLASEAVPLIIGVAPDAWPAHIKRHSLSEASRQLCEQLCTQLQCAADDAIEVMRVYAWAREQRISLPLAFERVVEFVVQVLPGAVIEHYADTPAGAAAGDERERILGAALALVTRFPQQCRDHNGFFDAGQIADLLLEKGAVWFPLTPPEMSRDAIATLLETYLS